MSPSTGRVPGPPGTLAHWLRALPDDTLVRLFRLRPDLATPPPPDFDILAARLEIRGSVSRALERLDTFTLEIVQALTLLPNPVSVAELTAFCGGLDLGAALESLRERLVVWGPDEALCLVGVAFDLLGERPLGLGRPVRDCLAGYRQAQLARVAAAVGLPDAVSDGLSASSGGLGDSDDSDLSLDPALDSARDPALDHDLDSDLDLDLGAGRHLGAGSHPVRRENMIEMVSAAFADPRRITALLDGCSARARRLAERLAAGPALGATSDADRLLSVSSARSPVEELLARGLLIGIEPGTVELPREVGLVLRGADRAGPLHPEPPEVTGREVAADAVDPAAALAADALVRAVTTLLTAWGSTPVTPLRTGGLSVRDLKNSARLMDVPETEAAVVIDAAAAAGLVDLTPGTDVQFVPTNAYDRWCTETVAMRWAVLAEGWLRSPSAAWLVGGRDERGRQIAALSLDARRPGAPDLRGEVLRAVATAPEGVAPTPESVRARLAWRSPRRTGPLLDGMIGGTLTEAEVVGFTGRGAPTTLGRLVARRLAAAEADDPGRGSGRSPAADEGLCHLLADAMAPLLPEPVEELLIQTDLTAVAPGPLVPRVAAELSRMADVESAGAATVYRFTENSLRRAMDAGSSADDLHDLLGRLARGGVPQSLTYLIDDTARRHGRLRSGPAASYLRCDDTALLTEVVASRRTQALAMRRVAPTIVISSLPVSELLEGLRAAGFAPVAEAPDGRIVLARPEVHRTPARTHPPAAESVATRANQLRDVVRLVRRGDDSTRAARAAQDAAGARLGLVRSAPVILVMLQGAVRDGRRVLLGYVNQQGTPSDRVVRPTLLEGGWLTAWDELSEAPRRFALHRVTGVADIDDPFGGPPVPDSGDWVVPPAADDLPGPR
ncbi:helicase-associated domain-containing protein [Parafrankia discariae]|uniref:helicase-associated domain-containing protein n=1 Tax=Parafrankia discariae TaxID=365528 RepID=UPI000551AC12|nr:helicase-associated domain-containing protein [Parafrankia discariae]